VTSEVTDVAVYAWPGLKNFTKLIDGIRQRTGTNVMTLRERCGEKLHELHSLSRSPLNRERQIDVLLEFIVSEQGRAADPRLERALPLVLYFKDDKERDGFIKATAQQLGWRSKKV
jgi:hypothetical protein